MTDDQVAELLATPGAVERKLDPVTNEWVSADPRAGFCAYSYPTPVEVLPVDQEAEIDRRQEEMLGYAVGDDLVVDGVVYDREQWQHDGEGGVEPRMTPEERAAREVRHAALDAAIEHHRREDARRA